MSDPQGRNGFTVEDDDPFGDPLEDLDLLKPSNWSVAEEVKKQLLRKEAQKIAKSIEAKELLSLSEDRTYDGLAFLQRRLIGEPVWGQGDSTLWPKGQGTTIFGDDGAGKSTLMQQIALAAKGLRDSEVLGYPVARLDGVIVYIAADRPSNVQESFARMIDTGDPVQSGKFDDGFRFWSGAVPFLADDDPKAFAQWCVDRAHGENVAMVIIDSVKDVVSDCSANLPGAQYNRMVQELIERGIEYGCCHHNRKGTADNKKPNKLTDVYGSRFLYAGMGSVLNIWITAASRPERELTQLKSPYGRAVRQIDYSNDAMTGTQKISSDMGDGITSQLYKARENGLTDNELVFRLYGLDSNDDGHKAARARVTRWLTKKVEQDGAYERKAVKRSGRAVKVWRLKIDGIDYPDEPEEPEHIRRLKAQVIDLDRQISEIDS